MILGILLGFAGAIALAVFVPTKFDWAVSVLRGFLPKKGGEEETNDEGK